MPHRFKIGIITEILVMILVFILIFGRYTDELYSNLRIPIIISGLILTFYNMYYFYIRRYIIYVFLLLFCFGIINVFFVGNINFYSLIMDCIISLSVAVFLLQNKLSGGLWKIYIFISIIVLEIIWFNSNGYQLFEQTSRNYISIFLIFYYFLYNIILERNGFNEGSVVLLGIIFILSVDGAGRGGIIATGFMFIALLLYRLFRLWKYNKFYLIISCILTILVCILIFNNIDYITDNYFSRFISDNTASRSDEERLSILDLYLQSNDNIFNIIFGSAFKDISFLYVTNMHNSYLQLHAYYGVIVLVLLFIGLIRSSIILFNERKIGSMVILLGVIIRAATDHTFPTEVFTIIILYYILMKTPSVKKLEV